MATDLLRVTANERVDLVDFEYLADTGFQANVRQPNAQFMTNPNGQRSFIIDGFTMTNPAGKQLSVAKGRAILGQRDGALIHYGVMTSEGDATKIIDMGPLTPATYGVYVRFEYAEGDSGSRIFWNPAGTGSELAQTVATRRKANWSIRVEVSNPGGEWLKIGEANNAGGGLVITDQRPLYFEGKPSTTYASGWSTEGGGAANDRNADRKTYGVKDLQTFTNAMRQGLEDLKGRGLRRWWDKGIGGMNVGFDTDPIEDRIAVGDVDTFLEGGTPGAQLLQVEPDLRLFMFDADTPILAFDWADGDRLVYDRTTNTYSWQIAAGSEMQLNSTGLAVTNGLYVGSATGTRYDDDAVIAGGLSVGVTTNPDADQIILGDDNFRFDFDGTDPRLVFDDWAGTPDEITYDRSANSWIFKIQGAAEYTFADAGLSIRNGLYVGSATGVPTDNDIYAEGVISAELGFDATTNGIVNTGAISGATSIDGTGDLTMGSITMTGNIYTTGNIGYDSNDYIDWSNNAYMRVIVNGVEEARFATDGLRVTNGIYVGSATGTPTDNNIYAEGTITAASTLAGASLNVGTGAVTGGAGSLTSLNMNNGTITNTSNITPYQDLTEDLGSSSLRYEYLWGKRFYYQINESTLSLGTMVGQSTAFNIWDDASFFVNGYDSNGNVISWTNDEEGTAGRVCDWVGGPNSSTANYTFISAKRNTSYTETGQIRTANGVFGILDVSDPRMKEDILDTQVDGLDVIKKLKLIEHRFKPCPGERTHIKGKKIDRPKQSIALDALNCQQVFPDMVCELGQKHPDGSPVLGTMRSQLIPVLVKAVQQLAARVEALEGV